MMDGMVRKGSARRPSLLIFGVVAVQVLIGLAGVALWLAAQVSDATPGVPAVPQANLAAPATLESGLPIAFARAQAWHGGAQLVVASGQVDWPEVVPAGEQDDVPGGGWLTYVFAVPDRDNPRSALPTYTLTLERLRGTIVAEEPLVPGIPMPPAAPLLGAYPISSTRALILAEERGGTAYRHVCPLQRHLTRISLDTTNPTAHRWIVTYRDDRFRDRNAMLVRIDAGTGEVVGPEMHVPLDAGACDETVEE